jgi:chemotaxis receptor (MCP) glutamine deamidase CheD
MEISVVGGANVLQEGDIPDKVIASVLDCLRKEHLTVRGMRVGGIKRRSVFLDTMSGDVHYTEGDSVTKTLLTKIERI